MGNRAVHLDPDPCVWVREIESRTSSVCSFDHDLSTRRRECGAV
jgi:hypothetical protein